MAGWNADTAAGPLGATVTLVDGSNFCISGLAGDMQLANPRRAAVQNMGGVGIANYVSVLEAV